MAGTHVNQSRPGRTTVPEVRATEGGRIASYTDGTSDPIPVREKLRFAFGSRAHEARSRPRPFGPMLVSWTVVRELDVPPPPQRIEGR